MQKAMVVFFFTVGFVFGWAFGNVYEWFGGVARSFSRATPANIQTFYIESQ